MAYHKWTKEEEKFLIKYYPTYRAHYCAKQLNLLWRQINSKAALLNIKIQDEEGYIICQKCYTRKDDSEFYIEKRYNSRVRTCKQCWSLNSKNKYYKDHEQTKEKNRFYTKKRYLRDKINRPYILFKNNLRIRIYSALKGKCKSKSTMKLIGCSIENLQKHLELKFQDGMSWANYGKWHVDHIKPCASFDLSNQKQQEECFHYTNLQPLWARDNIIKGAKC